MPLPPTATLFRVLVCGDQVVYMIGEGEEVDGQEAGEEVHFSRVISAGGASSYRLNGKEVCNPSFMWCYRHC